MDCSVAYKNLRKCEFCNETQKTNHFTSFSELVDDWKWRESSREEFIWSFEDARDIFIIARLAAATLSRCRPSPPSTCPADIPGWRLSSRCPYNVIFLSRRNPRKTSCQASQEVSVAGISASSRSCSDDKCWTLIPPPRHPAVPAEQLHIRTITLSQPFIVNTVLSLEHKIHRKQGFLPE